MEEVKIIVLAIHKNKIVASWVDKGMDVTILRLDEDPSESGDDRIDRLAFEIEVEYGSWIDPNAGFVELKR